MNITRIAWALFAGVMLLSATALAQPGSPLKPSETILLYPGGQQAGKGLPEAKGPGENNGITGPEAMPPYGDISNIGDSARIDLYFPKKPNGQMVIVCPGGSYQIVSSYNEGLYVADWMTRRGITVAVVKYRLPNGHWEVPLTDVQNAFRYCRAHAAEWGVKQIGVAGFSAGGHLAATATTLYEDAVTRPDFSILVYPVITMDHAFTHEGTRVSLLGQDSRWIDRAGKSFDQWHKNKAQLKRLVRKYSNENNVTPDTPPVFLAHCTDDNAVPVKNSLVFYSKLVENKVPVEMHIFPKGGHGWGFSSADYVEHDRLGKESRQVFETALEYWLDKQLQRVSH